MIRGTSRRSSLRSVASPPSAVVPSDQYEAMVSKPLKLMNDSQAQTEGEGSVFIVMRQDVKESMKAVIN